MKDIINISIAGISFTVTSDAYTQLQGYLNTLGSGYKNNPDGAEIIADIEARIVELILSKQPSEAVVSTVIVKDIIDQLGYPNEIGGDDFEEPFRSDARIESGENTFPRRLYRYSEGAKLGGVCNGLGIYMDIDPTWIRLSMFVPLLLLIILPSIGFLFLNAFLGSMFGSIVLLYFVLWIVVPLARSPRQKLEMRGKKITISSIESSVGEQESPMSQQIGRSSSVMSQLFVTLGRIVLLFTKFVIILIGLSLAIVVVVLFTAMVAMIFGANIDGLDSSTDMYHVFSNLKGISSGGYIALIFGVMLMPLVILVYHIIKFVFKLPHKPKVTWILSGIWLILLIYACAITVNNVDVIRNNIESTKFYERRHIKYKYLHKYERRRSVIVELRHDCYLNYGVNQSKLNR